MNIPGIHNPIEQEGSKKELSKAEKAQIEQIQKALQPGANLKVNLTNTKTKIETRENGKGMKIAFKFNKDEAEAFNNIFGMIKPNGVSQDQFLKLLVFKGMDVFQSELHERYEKLKKEKPEEFAKLEAEAKAQLESSVEAVETEDAPIDIVKD